MPFDHEEPRVGQLGRKPLALRAAVVTVWLGGLGLAIRAGFEPGFGRDPQHWPYPLGHVLVGIVQITLVSLCLYDLLRPQPEGSSLARTARAAAVSFVTLAWILTNSWTDQPGYAYIAQWYALIVTALLFFALAIHAVVATVHAIRRRWHAA